MEDNSAPIDAAARKEVSSIGAARSELLYVHFKKKKRK